MEIKENNLYEHLAVPKKNVSGQGLTLRPDLDLVLMLDGDPTRMGRNYFRVMIQFSTNEFRSGEWIEALPDWFAAALLDEGVVSLRTLRRVLGEWDDFNRCAPPEEGMAAILTPNTFFEFRREEGKVTAYIRAHFEDREFTSTWKIQDHIASKICVAEVAEA